MTKPCEVCDSVLSYDDRFDSYFCFPCNEWKEKVCGSDDCYHDCKNRPEKPCKIKKTLPKPKVKHE